MEDAVDVTICRPLAALELGFHTRLLRTLQESVWATRLTDIRNVDSGLESIHCRLVALSDRLNPLQFSRFLELKTRIEDRHDEAAVFRGGLTDELFEEVGDPEEAMRLLPRRVEERAGVLRAWQRQDWDEVRLLTRKAVEGDRRLEAWWEIGLRVADMMLRVGTPQAPATWTEADVEGLLAAVAKLPGAEKAWVEDILPSTPPSEPRFPFLVNEAYQDLRGFIPEFEKRRRLADQKAPPAHPAKKRPNRGEVPDNYEANILIKKYLDSHPRATIREVAKEVKLSTGKVSQLDAWKQWMAAKNAARPTPRRAARRLTDEMLAVRGQDDDPAAKVMRDEAIWQWLLEKAGPEERAELHKKNAGQRATLIELAREQYEREHYESSE